MKKEIRKKIEETVDFIIASKSALGRSETYYNGIDKLLNLLTKTRQEAYENGYQAASKRQAWMKEQVEKEAVEEVIEKIDPFDLVESCVPDCTSVEHAYHQGTWDSHLKLEKILKSLKSEGRK